MDGHKIFWPGLNYRETALMGALTAAALWRIDAALILALDEGVGPPVDSYVNGSQTWLVDVGPPDTTLEFRLHPVARYVGPTGLSHYDLWETVVAALSSGADPSALTLGDETRSLAELWDGLEVFEAYEADLEPAQIASSARESIGREPDRAGLVDHAASGTAWDHSDRSISLFDLLEDQLKA